MGKKGEPPPVENPKTRFLLGTFSAPPSLAINEPWSDRRMLDSRHKGKNMGAGKWRCVFLFGYYQDHKRRTRSRGTAFSCVNDSSAF